MAVDRTQMRAQAQRGLAAVQARKPMKPTSAPMGMGASPMTASAPPPPPTYDRLTVAPNPTTQRPGPTLLSTQGAFRNTNLPSTQDVRGYTGQVQAGMQQRQGPGMNVQRPTPQQMAVANMDGRGDLRGSGQIGQVMAQDMVDVPGFGQMPRQLLQNLQQRMQQRSPQGGGGPAPADNRFVDRTPSGLPTPPQRALYGPPVSARPPMDNRNLMGYTGPTPGPMVFPEGGLAAVPYGNDNIGGTNPVGPAIPLDPKFGNLGTNPYGNDNIGTAGFEPWLGFPGGYDAWIQQHPERPDFPGRRPPNTETTMPVRPPTDTPTTVTLNPPVMNPAPPAPPPPPIMNPAQDEQRRQLQAISAAMGGGSAPGVVPDVAALADPGRGPAYDINTLRSIVPGATDADYQRYLSSYQQRKAATVGGGGPPVPGPSPFAAQNWGGGPAAFGAGANPNMWAGPGTTPGFGPSMPNLPPAAQQALAQQWQQESFRNPYQTSGNVYNGQPAYVAPSWY